MLNVPSQPKTPLVQDVVSLAATAEHTYCGNYSGTPNNPAAGFHRHREASIFKTATATASGNTTVWTPATGNRFRLLGYYIDLTENAATAGGAVVVISWQDGTTPIGLSHSIFIPNAGGSTAGAAYQSGHIDLGGYGYLSIAANSVLNINLSAALSSGTISVIALGTEE